MYGALLGDRIGAPYEFDRGDKTKDFPLFSEESQFTDDSVMTIAVAQALMEGMGKSEEQVKKLLVSSMQDWGRRYPDAGYGFRFAGWLWENEPSPYGSFGNGSAMRVSSAGWLYDSLEETRVHARWTAEVTHNHPEGIKGAEATASAIFLAREGHSKEEIKAYIRENFGYDLSRTCDEIRPDYCHVESCQETVPEAITAFLEGESLEDVFRTAVSLGGDSDTLTCIAGSIAEAYYGVGQELRQECIRGLTEDMREVLRRFDKMRKRTLPSQEQMLQDEKWQEQLLKEAFSLADKDPSGKGRIRAVQLLKRSFLWVPCRAIMSPQDEQTLERMVAQAEEKGDLDFMKGQTLVVQNSVRLVPELLKGGDQIFFPAFTSQEEMGEFWEGCSQIQKSFLEILQVAENQKEGVAGLLINACSDRFVIPIEIFGAIKKLEELDFVRG